MLAIWIVIAVVAVAVVVAGGVVIVGRRRRSGRGGPQVVEAAGPATLERPPPPAPPTGPAPPPVRQPQAPPAPAPVRQPQAPPVPAEPEVVEAPAELVPADLRERMGRTRGRFGTYLRSLRSRGSVDDDTWDELEEALLGADVGVATTMALLDELRERVRGGELRGPDAVVEALKEELRQVLQSADDSALRLQEGVTNVWLFVGVNGVGKTTTIGKVARAQVEAGRSVVLAAGDTFRAAAAEQLTTWGERAGVDVVRGAEGGDPSAVVFDAVQRAAARGRELVLADTAGRLHTKVNLVEELKKIRRVADRPPGTVTEVLLVLDATTGQNGLVQARQFLEAVGVTGVVLTKLDGTAKGGIVVAIEKELGLPVKLVGIGEGAADLVPFDPGSFVDALFDTAGGEPAALR